MKPEESFIGQPIRSLQTMLRTIASVHPDQLSVVPDGVYTPQTGQAVSAFQRRKGLPVTGTADLATWEAVAEEYRIALIESQPAHLLRITLNPGEVIRLGDSSIHIPLIQTVLFVLSQIYDRIPEPEITGVWDPASRDALMEFQAVSDLEPTGELDKITWHHLALHYTHASDYASLAPAPGA